MQEKIQHYLQRLDNEIVPFAETLALIDELYAYTPTAFSNGVDGDVLESPAGVNEGSCKVFAFARLHGLSKAQTLACFGEHCLKVLEHPEGTDHPNIRLFKRHGWEGIRFDGQPLTVRDVS